MQIHDAKFAYRACLFTDEHKAQHLQMARDWLQRYEADPGFKDKVVTMDESWVSHFMPETKQQSKQWSPKVRVSPFPIPMTHLLT